MANANGNKPKRNMIQRAIAAIFGKSTNGFVAEGTQVDEATRRSVIAEHDEQMRQEGRNIRESLEQAKRRVESADFGELTAGELQDRLDGGEAPEDALACIEDVFSILRMERGEDAEREFQRKLWELMTEGTDDDIAPSKPLLPESLVDSGKLGEGVAKWLENVLLFRKAEAEKDGQLIDYMRGTVGGKYGPEAIKSFRMALFSMMIRSHEKSAQQKEMEQKQAAFNAEAEALAERAEQIRDALRPKFDPLNTTLEVNPIRPGIVAESTPLKTQRDGRLFAMDVLDRLGEADANEASANPVAPAESFGAGDEWHPYRSGPQWDGFYKDISRLLKEASPEAVKGFASIFTDALADNLVKDGDSYRDDEESGLHQDFGTPGSALTPPEGVKDGKVLPEAAFSSQLPEQQPEQPKQRRGKQSKAEKQAAEALSDTFAYVYALDDMARRLEKTPFGFWTMFHAVDAVTAKLRGDLDKAAAALPAKHKARKIILDVRQALDAMRELILNADGGDGKKWDTPKAQVGVAMFALVQSIGANIERAEIACGEPFGTSGIYLAGDGRDPAATYK